MWHGSKVPLMETGTGAGAAVGSEFHRMVHPDDFQRFAEEDIVVCTRGFRPIINIHMHDESLCIPL